MNKISKLLVTILSAIALAFTSVSSSFAKVEGEYIVLGAAVSLTGSIRPTESTLKMAIT
jgi:hypothetical protein